MNTGGGRVWEKVGDWHFGMNEELSQVNITHLGYPSFGTLNTTVY